MRRVLLAMLLTVAALGVVCAQEIGSLGDATVLPAKESKGLTEAAAKHVTEELMELEAEKVMCFSPIGEEAGWSATWIKYHNAEREIHLSERLRSKEEVMDELRSGIRRNLVNRQFNQTLHIYGDGGDGTTVVLSSTSPGGGMNMAGVRQFGGGGGLGTDVWYKQDGRWWFIVHPPGAGESEPPSGEASVDHTPTQYRHRASGSL